MDKETTKETNREKMSQENKKKLIILGAAAIVLFYLIPLLTTLLPADPAALVMVILMLVVNQIFMVVVGWQANYFPKFGVYMPAIAIVLYLISEFLFFGQVSWTVEINYMESGYIAYFLKKLLMKRQRIEEKKNNKPFPKGVGKK